jgi:hypothetical protein
MLRGAVLEKFVTHHDSHADQEFALWLHQSLESRGVRCWLDEKNMTAGERILDAVEKAISGHDRILLCCSKISLESWWVKDEARKVHELERQAKSQLRIIPLLLDRYLLENWQDGLAADLRSRLGIDFTNWNARKDNSAQIEKLFKALTRTR